MTSFAVIITNYNYQAYVTEAVDSVLAQIRPATQIIMIDDGSTDGSKVLLQERYGADPRVTLMLGENSGQLAAFQRGLAVAQADVVCFLDGDDRWEPAYLQRIGDLYDARKDVDFVFSDLQVFGEDNQQIRFADGPVDLGFTVVSTYILNRWYGAPTSALSLRLRWAQETLDLPETFRNHLRLYADACLVHGTSIMGGRKYYLPTGCVGYRSHGKNGWWTSRQQPITQYKLRLRNRGVICHYAARMGIEASCADFSKYEYRTKVNPSRADRNHYILLALHGTAPWWKRFEQALSIFSGHRRGR